MHLELLGDCGGFNLLVFRCCCCLSWWRLVGGDWLLDLLVAPVVSCGLDRFVCLVRLLCLLIVVGAGVCFDLIMMLLLVFDYACDAGVVVLI